MEYNGNDQSQSLEFSVILYVKTYDKRFDVQLSNFQPFHEAEAYGKLQHIIPVPRGALVYRRITKVLSIVAFV